MRYGPLGAYYATRYNQAIGPDSLGAYYATRYNQAIGPDSLAGCSGGCGCKGCGGLGAMDTGKTVLYVGIIASVGLLAIAIFGKGPHAPRARRR